MEQNKKKLRVWWVPQVPMKSFHVDVSSIEEGAKLINVLAKYDAFQFENKIKPDYCNAGGLQEWSEQKQGWVDWYDDETGIDDPEEYLESHKTLSVEPQSLTAVACREN